MEANVSPSNSKAMFWSGWILSGLAGAMLLISGLFKFAPMSPEAEQGLQHIGWRADQVGTLGILEIACVILYLIPQTAVLGAILVTGYMGGAIATHLRVGDPFIVQAIIPMVFWLGLWLREPRLRQLLPLR
jgi:DoxX-like family